MKDLELEKENLKNTIEVIKEVLTEEEAALNDVYNNFIGNKEELQRIANSKKLHIKNLTFSKDKPYFARVDFTTNTDNKKYSIYIGKNGVSKGSDIVVTDWRAPISSLYYDSEIGKCSYEAPEGIITGDLSLKRQYEIENGTLLDYIDVDLVSNDELLQKYLNTNNDTRLKNIVATIQKEQNEVIRKSIFDNLIIQGVAGSGKTTVALHRIAYLVYNYINSIKPNQYLVIGPNKVFLKYISSVLPELDVDGISQYTYEQFAKEYIEESIDIISSKSKVTASIAGKNNTDIDQFKCSMKYKEMLDKFLEVYIYSITNKPLLLDDFEVLSSQIIKEVFNQFNSNNLKTRIELTIEKLCNIIENNYDNIMVRYNNYFFEEYQNSTNDIDRKNLQNKNLKNREELSKKCRTIIRKYFSKAKIESTKLYRIFLDSINNYDIYKYKNLSLLKQETLKNIKNKKYDFEDLAALIYIKTIISPSKEYKNIKHVVIDEAQDFGEFNFYSLKQSLPSATFSIFGDLAQSIYDYHGINNWQEVNKVMFEDDVEIINFNKSYRTTCEIMSVADEVSDYIGLGKSELVVRHGNNVTFSQIQPEKNIEYIIKRINEFKKKGYQNIAIISKTDLLSNYMNDDLMFSGFRIPNVEENDDITDPRFHICTISNRLAKGLEFDAVIIPDASEKIYASNNVLDMKLLYVAITRALHELEIIYSNELTKPLSKKLALK